MKRVTYSILTICSLICTVGIAQPSVRISADNFLEAVSTHPDIQAHADQMDMMDAAIEVAKISPDPSLTMGNLSGDVSGIRMPHQLFVGVNYTMETGGKRKQRIRYAKAQRDLAETEHAAFVNEFKRDALLLFQQCWMLEQQIREANEYRADILSINIIDETLLAKQQLMVLESERVKSELEGRYAKAVAELNGLVSHAFGDQPVLPDGWVWSSEAGVTDKENSVNLDVARASADVLKEEVLLSATDRAPDLSFTLGNSFITRATNTEAPSPQYNAITASVTIPLKFSNWNSGQRRISELRTQQARTQEIAALTEDDAAWLITTREINRLAESYTQLSALIGLEEKFITKISKTDFTLRMQELSQLSNYKTQRWQVLERIAGHKADLFVRTGVLSTPQPGLASGTN
ncbi:MAG TPA: TolC family protein [Ohtaekwangia sp.]